MRSNACKKSYSLGALTEALEHYRECWNRVLPNNLRHTTSLHFQEPYPGEGNEDTKM